MTLKKLRQQTKDLDENIDVRRYDYENVSDFTVTDVNLVKRKIVKYIDYEVPKKNYKVLPGEREIECEPYYLQYMQANPETFEILEVKDIDILILL